MSTQPRPLPRWMILVGSLGIVVHLTAILLLAVTAQSGPWWVGSLNMPTTAEPPEFSRGLNDFLNQFYLRPVHMTHNYHFASNMPERSTVKLEMRVLDESGQLLKVVRFPDPNANFWVRHRQLLLAQGLGDDRQLNLRPMPGVADRPLLRKVWFGKPNEEQKLVKKSENELLLKQREPEHMMGFSQPSPWSEALARSYARHALQQHGGAKAEIVRMSREPINPVILMPMTLDKTFFDRSFNTLVSNFGEYRRDQ